MAEPSISPEQREGARSAVEKLMEEVDKFMPSPEQRALKVWGKLDKTDLNVWDLICFCAEAMGYVMPLFPEFEPTIKSLSLNVYATHYRGAQAVKQWSEDKSNQLDQLEIDHH